MDTENKPRLCKVLNVGVYEFFKIKGYRQKFWVTRQGDFMDCGTMNSSVEELGDASLLCKIINYPELIVREEDTEPVLDDIDELKICDMLGALYVSRDSQKDSIDCVKLWKDKPLLIAHSTDGNEFCGDNDDSLIAIVQCDKFPDVKPGKYYCVVC